jgi:hypothetical protein
MRANRQRKQKFSDLSVHILRNVEGQGFSAEIRKGHLVNRNEIIERARSLANVVRALLESPCGYNAPESDSSSDLDYWDDDDSWNWNEVKDITDRLS